MGRRRKISVANEEKENDSMGSHGASGDRVSSSTSMQLHGPMYTIMSNVQLNETSHKKYIKELKQLYANMDHDAFVFTFIKMIKAAMAAEEANEYAETTLLFCAKFVSSYNNEDTHPVLIDICRWLLTTISKNPHIRFRLCQFVNMILKALGYEAALDDEICDNILEYMLHRLHDTSPNVRVQAILAMQRLQVPDNPEDPVLRAYQFHLCSDPSSRVRQAVITCMGRNYHTIPYILERLWDIDEKVRRHTYLHMSSYPVRSYKVSQRLTLLQQGLNDRSEAVRKVVVNIMLNQWIESYQKDLIGLITALKLDSNETEFEKFRKVAKQTLKEIFKRRNKEELMACLPVEPEGELHRCVPYDKLTIEIALYWQCLTEHLQAELAEEFDMILPELSTFCEYVEKFCQSQTGNMDKFEQMEFQYKLLSLMEILQKYDLGDEIGRGNLQKLLAHLLKNFNLNEKVIEVIVRCVENLITDQNARLQYFVEIIQDVCDLNGKHNDWLHDRQLINDLLAKSPDADLNLKLTSLKVKILDLEEQEMNYVRDKDYKKAQQITDERIIATEEYTNMLRPLLEKYANNEPFNRPLHHKVVKPESILKSLQITFYMIVSPKVSGLNPCILKLYNDFICRHLASTHIALRDWALKCGTACSMLYEALAKDVFEELYAQFIKNHNIRLWVTSITCIFELLDRYGMDNFVMEEKLDKSKRSGRQLYNTLEFLDSEDDLNVASGGQGVDVKHMMSHLLETCDDACIISAIITGFCRLILRGYITNTEIIEKLLLRYFNPSTDPKINQILGVFLENLIQRKKHGLLQPCLLPMITTVLSAPYENPLHDIRPENITRFIIDSTRQESSPICEGYIHNKIAETFLDEMKQNVSNKELCKLLAKELTTLELNVEQKMELKRKLKTKADDLIKSELDLKTIKHIIDFKDMLDGNFNPAPKPAAARNDSEDEEESNDEADVGDKDDDTETASNATDNRAKNLPPLSIATTESNSESLMPDIETATVNTESSASSTTAPTVVETESLDEAPPKDISPSARTPTTYGRDNVVDHRFLRKSLNISRSQSDTESIDGPPKIRIEARIDSDKKQQSKESSAQRQVAVQKNTRARRNLRYVESNNDFLPVKSSTESLNVGAAQNEAREKRVADSSKSSKEAEKGSKLPVRASARNAQRAVETTQKSDKGKATLDESDNEHNTSEVIPPSPDVASPQTTVLRRRRRGDINESATSLDITRRSTRSQSAQPAKKPQSSDTQPTEGAPTPPRHSRKRALQFTPKNATTSTGTPNTTSKSPSHKRLRSDKSLPLLPPMKLPKEPIIVRDIISLRNSRSRVRAAISPKTSTPAKVLRRRRSTGQRSVSSSKSTVSTTPSGQRSLNGSKSRLNTTPSGQRSLNASKSRLNTTPSGQRSLNASKSRIDTTPSGQRSLNTRKSRIDTTSSGQRSLSTRKSRIDTTPRTTATRRASFSATVDEESEPRSTIKRAATPGPNSDRSRRSSASSRRSTQSTQSAKRKGRRSISDGTTTPNAAARRLSVHSIRLTRQRGLSHASSSSSSIAPSARALRGKSTTKAPASRIPVKISKFTKVPTKGRVSARSTKSTLSVKVSASSTSETSNTGSSTSAGSSESEMVQPKKSTIMGSSIPVTRKRMLTAKPTRVTLVTKRSETQPTRQMRMLRPPTPATGLRKH